MVYNEGTKTKRGIYMENNNFCDNNCSMCLGYNMCRKSFKKVTPKTVTLNKDGNMPYKVTYKCDETGKTIVIKTNAKGIFPAIEDANRKLFNMYTHGDFYYPIKAEQMNV